MNYSPDTTSSTFDDQFSPRSRQIAYRWQILSRIAMVPFMLRSSKGASFEFSSAELEADVSYLVVSNHQSQWDSFVMLSAFTPNIAKRLLPFRAMTHNGVLRGGLVTGYLLGMGCFPAKHHDNMASGVECAGKFLRDGQTVFICPEGRRTLPEDSDPRPGVSALANIDNVMIIPAHIQWQRPRKWQKSFQLAFGKPFDGCGMSAQEIMNRVYSVELT